MKTLEQEFEDFQSCIVGFIDKVIPVARERLAQGYAVGGNIQRNIASQELRLEMCAHTLVISTPGAVNMKPGPETIHDFTRKLLSQITAVMQYPSQVKCSASPVATVEGMHLMSWFLIVKPDAPEAVCPKSLH